MSLQLYQKYRRVIRASMLQIRCNYENCNYSDRATGLEKHMATVHNITTYCLTCPWCLREVENAHAINRRESKAEHSLLCFRNLYVIPERNRGRRNAQASNDALNAQASNYALNAQASNYALNAQASNDALNGQASNDALNAQASNDALNAQASNDALNAQASNNALNAQASNDALNAQASNDEMNAQASNDATIEGEFSYLEDENQIPQQASNEALNAQASNDAPIEGEFSYLEDESQIPQQQNQNARIHIILEKLEENLNTQKELIQELRSEMNSQAIERAELERIRMQGLRTNCSTLPITMPKLYNSEMIDLYCRKLQLGWGANGYRGWIEETFEHLRDNPDYFRPTLNSEDDMPTWLTNEDGVLTENLIYFRNNVQFVEECGFNTILQRAFIFKNSITWYHIMVNYDSWNDFNFYQLELRNNNGNDCIYFLPHSCLCNGAGKHHRHLIAVIEEKNE